MNPIRNSIDECNENEWTCIKVIFHDEINYGIDDFVFFLNRARYKGIHKIFNCPLFSKQAQTTMKLFDLWLNSGTIDRFNWKTIVNSLNFWEMRRISRKMLTCSTLLTDVFKILKIRFHESTDKHLFSFQLFKFNLKIHGLRNSVYFLL